MKLLSVALFTLREYRRATWFYLELLTVLVFLFLYQDHFWNLGKQDVYPILGFFIVIITTLTTLRITRLETNPRIYILLTKRLSRTEYLLGKALAVLFLDGVFLLALFFVAFKFTGLHIEFTWEEALIRMFPLYLIQLMILGLFLFLSPLVLRGAYFLLGIAYVILGVNHPEQVPSFLLLPVFQLINLCCADTGFVVTSQVFQGIIYATLFFALALFSFNRREINYDPK